VFAPYGWPMHDWPVRDREIVAAIVAGNPAGLAAAYDRYASALYAYCRSLLGEPADAADAVQDTFVVAAAKLAGLREPDRLRPWLYAVARNECHRRLRAQARTTELDEAGDMTDASADVSGAAERGELRDLVRSAVGGRVSFTITVPQGLSVSQPSGSLTSGQSITITVTADPNNLPPSSSTLTVNPGGLLVTVVLPPPPPT
jgi:hypothetical protein